MLLAFSKNCHFEAVFIKI